MKYGSVGPKNYLLLIVVPAALLVAVCAVYGINKKGARASLHTRKLLNPSVAMLIACSRARYKAHCLNSSLLEFPGASGEQLVRISVNTTLHKVGLQLAFAKGTTKNQDMDNFTRTAYEDLVELLDDSMDLLTLSLNSIVLGNKSSDSPHDVLTWLSAALTNVDTSITGFREVTRIGGPRLESRAILPSQLDDLSMLATNSLNLYAAAQSKISHHRRKLMAGENMQSDFPTWVSGRDRALLETPASEIKFDVIVSKRGTCRTIGEAIKKAPENNKRRRFFILVEAGRYEEHLLKVGKRKMNIMIIGAGMGKTVITGSKSVQDKMTTFHTASFAAIGYGFIARDITFENTAGPTKHQAVALRVGGDHSVLYRCSIVGYQDTLYVHSNRQFYRECDIYGTVDFIFGNAAVVFQRCTLHARKPMQNQKNTITAQNRKDPDQNTGISIVDCRIVAERDLKASRSAFPTYLGRPWKMYSRTVVMLSYLGDHIDRAGWLEWNGGFALNTLYYGEYMNNGPGAVVRWRVNWRGYKSMMSLKEARMFTVTNLIFGSSWLPATGVPFSGGL